MKEKNSEIDWREKASNDLEYYLDTEEGRNKLYEMIRTETENIIQEIECRQGIKEAIWLSKFCLKCSHYSITKRNIMKCNKWEKRIVKPFFGKPLYNIFKTSISEDLKIYDLDWNSKSFNVPNLLIEEAIRGVNKGYPYPCFQQNI